MGVTDDASGGPGAPARGWPAFPPPVARVYAWPSLPALKLPLVGALVALILPWTPATELGSSRVPNTAIAYLDTPQYLFTALGLLVAALALAHADRWLGLGCAWACAGPLLWPSDLALATAHWLVLGAWGVVLVRRLDDQARRWMLAALVASCLCQVAYAGLQHWRIDLLWFGWTPPNLAYGIHPVGTLGNRRYLGAMLALTMPLAPLWALPGFVVGLVISRSWLALVAAAAGLLLRYRAHLTRGRVAGLLSAGLGVAVLIGLLGPDGRGWSWDTLTERLRIWNLARQDMGPRDWLLGHGLGGWWLRMQGIQVAHMAPGAPGLFLQAHNDVLQWTYETGLLGLAALLGFARSLRPVDAASTGALVTLAILALGVHIFHWPALVPTVLLVLGCATAHEESA